MPIDKHSAQFITNSVIQPTQSSAPGIWRLEDVNNSVAANRWPLAPNLLRRSLRFNSADSAYFNRSPSIASNRTTNTFSLWFKRSNLTGSGLQTIWCTDYNTSTNYGSDFFIDANDKLGWYTYGSSGVLIFNLLTAQVFRDINAWYHVTLLFDSTQSTASERAKIFVNNTQAALSASTYPSQNAQAEWNSTERHQIGAFYLNGSVTRHFNGHIAEVNFVDGQALTPASFGEIDPQTGVWVPKLYTGTYGTNGFRLNFSNNSSTTTLGYDSSGQGNNWTANNFSVTSGIDNDSLLDTPSMYGVDTGLGGEVGGNYCTMNPLSFSNSPYYGSPANATITNGNLDCQSLVAGYRNNVGTIPFPATGKWYFEATIVSSNGSGNNQSAGITSITDTSKLYVIDFFATSTSSSRKIENGTSSGTYATVGVGTIVGVAVDCDNAKAYIAINNSWIDSGNPTAVANGYSMAAGQTYVPFFSGYNSGITSFNFGQRPFVYPAPAGFKCLTTQNLSTPLGNVAATQANKYFDVITYVGNGGAKSIQVGFQPDFIWIKNRNVSNNYHNLIDSLRGANRIYSNGDANSLTNAEESAPFFAGFTGTGFDLNGNNGNVNGANESYVAWCWNAGGVSVINGAGTNGATIASTYRVNLQSGFSIVTYTGNGVVGATVRHGLSSIPGLVLIKNRSTTANWAVKMPTVMTGAQRLQLNTTNGYLSESAGTGSLWNAVNPNSSVITLGDFSMTNSNGNNYVAYCWAEVPGYSAFGSYTGNGSADGPFVYTGFKPRWVMVKQSAGTSAGSGSWQIFDTARDLYNPSDYRLQANSNGSEATGAPSWDVLSNGFKLRSLNANWNETSGTYIYAAFAETPFKNTRAR